MHAGSYPQSQFVLSFLLASACDAQGRGLAAVVWSLTLLKILDVRVPVFVTWAPWGFRGRTNIYSCASHRRGFHVVGIGSAWREVDAAFHAPVATLPLCVRAGDSAP